MSLTYPLSLATFFDVLTFRSGGCRFILSEPVQINGSADGTIYTAANGSAMWQGTLVTAPVAGPRGKRVEALMDALRGANRSFLVRDATYYGPQNDPTGAILANRTLAIADVETSRVKIGPAAGASVLEGYPPELLLLPGDMIGWQYGVNPVRYALHRVSPAAASYGYDAAGVSEWIDVMPQVRGSPQVGDPVQMVAPVCKAVPAPGSIEGGAAVTMTAFDGWSLDWRQTLR